MAGRPFSTDPSYVQYIKGLHRLHALALAGEDEGAEADEVRDSLDRPWACLTETEKKRIRGLSADLYSLSEPKEPILESNPQTQRKLVEAIKAREAGEWDTALELLRRWERYIEPALLSHLRGSIWMAAGDHATAALFFRKAAELEPSSGEDLSLFLHALDKSNPHEALTIASTYLSNDEKYAPAVVIMSAMIRLRSAVTQPVADARKVMQDLIPRLERTLARLQARDESQTSLFGPVVEAMALLGFCYDKLGNTHESLRYYNQGIAIDPFDVAMRIGRGILCYGVDAQAINDFKFLVQQRVSNVWPYFFLAHHSLVQNLFDKCKAFCEQGLSTPPVSDTVSAYLNEWLAISLAELGYPQQRVRSAFEEALRLAPDNERIRQNYDVFESRVASPPQPQRPWEKPIDAIIQEYGRVALKPSQAAA